MQILTWKSNRDEESIVEDLNEIFNRRRERAMRKIKLNKTTKQSSEKKSSQYNRNKQSSKKKQWTEQTVKSYACNACKSYFFWLGELRWDTV